MEKSFAMLTLLSDMWKDDAGWQENVAASIPNSQTDGFTVKMDDDEAVIQQFACDELEFTGSDVNKYYFLGDPSEAHFYKQEAAMFKVKATGQFCVMLDDID